MSTADQRSGPAELSRRANRLRGRVLRAIHLAGAGHTGGSLSCLDLLTILYHRVLRIDPAHPGDPARDRYIQSKGHSVEALYVVLASRGFFPDADLDTLCRYRSPLVGHPTRKTPGIEQNTGALGHGLSVAAGMALGARLGPHPFNVYCLLGDGELAEGSNWEAALCAAHHRLDNLTAIIDHNGLQITGAVREVMNVEPLADKWRAFGWEVREVDGHDFETLCGTFDALPFAPGKPSLILAHTIKGRGVSFMENQAGWHHRVPKEDELRAALAELESTAATPAPHGH
ncbi:MAG: transketolase [Puniceicoccaceae bacterium]|nr:MAG: transketolase [Puniceicoccaceae bacterium]